MSQPIFVVVTAACGFACILLLATRRRDCKPSIDRYARQRAILGVDGQDRVRAGSVLIVGCGGLASGCVPLLVGAGVRDIALVDFDVVEECNLHRQVVHTCVGEKKTWSMRRFAKGLNPHVGIHVFDEKLQTFERAVELFSRYDVIVDCCDNVDTRFLVNEACVATTRPLVSASALGTSGQLAVYWVDRMPQAGCYRCAFPNDIPPRMRGTCSEDGVLGPVPAILGGFQALECIKLLATLNDIKDDVIGDSPSKKEMNVGGVMCLFELGSLCMDPFSVVKLRRRPECPCCSKVVAEKLGRGVLGLTQTTDFDQVNDVCELGENTFVVDVRSTIDSTFRRADLRISMEDLRADPLVWVEKVRSLAQDRAIICVCHRGVTSRVAGRILSRHLKKEIGSLIGGVGS